MGGFLHSLGRVGRRAVSESGPTISMETSSQHPTGASGRSSSGPKLSARNDLVRGLQMMLAAAGIVALARGVLFFLARGLTYVGWVHTRQETETAQELTPMLLEAACERAEDYLSNS